MQRGDQVLRQWNLLKTLQTRGEGVPLRRLSEEFGVSERTIQRDFSLLQEIGFPVEHEEDEYGKRFWRMPHDFFRSGPLVLGLTEAVSLHLAERFFIPLAGTHFAEGLQSVLSKVRSLLPAAALSYFEGLDETLHVRSIGRTDYSSQSDMISLLSRSVQFGETVELIYNALWRGEAYTTLCDPYGLIYYDGDLFMVGRSHRAADLRIFKLTRVSGVCPTDMRFRRPADFSLEEYFRSSFGIFQPGDETIEIVVRFNGPGAALVQERVWHESQRLEWITPEQTLFEPAPEEPDSLIATFHLANRVEFKRWIKGYGAMAEILRPDWLRAELHDELLATARLYEP